MIIKKFITTTIYIIVQIIDYFKLIWTIMNSLGKVYESDGPSLSRFGSES